MLSARLVRLRKSTWIVSPTSARITGPRIPSHSGCGLQTVKVAAAYAIYEASGNWGWLAHGIGIGRSSIIQSYRLVPGDIFGGEVVVAGRCQKSMRPQPRTEPKSRTTAG
jgi:hypothetical protein